MVIQMSSQYEVSSATNSTPTNHRTARWRPIGNKFLGLEIIMSLKEKKANNCASCYHKLQKDTTLFVHLGVEPSHPFQEMLLMDADY